jgi:type I restriction enzyme, S subunit
MSFEEWKEVKLSDICDTIQYGYTQSASTEKVGPKFLRITDIRNDFIDWDDVPYCQISSEDFQKYKLEEGDIVIARTGATTGINKYIDSNIPESVFASYLIRIKINKDNDPRFVGYVLSSKKYEDYIKSILGGSAQPNANAKTLTSFTFLLPPKDEQQKISKILSSIDNKIELNNQINKKLEEMAQAIFKRWFVDFEFPNENGEPYKSSGGEFEESELGLIPKGWFVTEMGSFLIPKNERVNDKNLILYSTTNQGLQLRDEKFKKNLTKNNKKNKIIEKNDIVFGMSREILNFGVMKDKIGAVSPAYHVCKVDCDIYNAELLEMYMRIRSDYFLDLIKPGAREGQVIDKAHLQKKRLIVPKKEVQDHFYEVFSSIKNTMQTIEDQTSLLLQIRDTLLPKLMSGEIRVPLENEGRHQDEQLQRV